MNKANILIEIEVSRSSSSRNCKFATGFPVGRDRIITAAHVLKARFKNPLIEAVFRDPTRPGSCSREICEVAWNGRDHQVWGAPVDIAVLTCKLPKHFPTEVPLMELAPSGPVEAYVQGYPEITKKGDRQSPLDAFGKFGSIPNGQVEFELHCDDALKHPDLWKGVSGAPVFVGDSLAGIVREYRGTHENDHFGVIAIFRLLEDEGFRNAIGWLDAGDLQHRDKVKEKIKSKLESIWKETVSVRGNKESIHELLVGTLEVAGIDKVDVLVSYLMEYHETTIPRLVRLHKQLRDSGHENEKKYARTIREIIDDILPFYIPRHVRTEIRRQLQHSRAVLVQGSVTTPVGAEAAAAWFDRRGVSFTGKKDSMGYLIGQSQVGDLPLDSAPPDSPERPSSQIVIDALYEEAKIPKRRGAGKTKEEDLRIHYMARKEMEERTPFCVVSLPRDDKDRAPWIEAMKAVKGLIYIEMCPDSETHAQETLILTCLNTCYDLEI